jgi:CheY-like chemotaxis protein
MIPFVKEKTEHDTKPQNAMSKDTPPLRIGFTTPNKIIPGARILVVDDDEAIRKLHAAILTFEGYEVEMAEDGADALEQLATGVFDLVFTDRQMPILDGEGMVLALRSAGIRIPVVMISGSVAQSPLYAGVAREVSAALLKPIRAADLLAAIFTALHPYQPELRAAA